ncbi:MAG: HD domain-containing protein [Alphaproteobacteria bacterium]|nr:HD domain-containing protein [Alphaproteobacteria bacterium]
MITPARWQHILGVARRAKVLAEKLRPQDEQFAQDMFLLGMLHDFGYEFSEEPGRHPEIGAEILKRQGYRYWQEVANHGSVTVTEVSDELFILSCADMTTGPNGESFTMQERIDNMSERYGENSHAHKKAIIGAKRLQSDPRFRYFKGVL